MNGVGEWMKFFHERAGPYRYNLKGSGVVCDTLMAIGKTFAQTATQSLKKGVEKAAAQAATQAAENVRHKQSKKGERRLTVPTSKEPGERWAKPSV